MSSRFGVKLYRIEFKCRRCHKFIRVDRREGHEDMLPKGWMIRVIPDCGMTHYTREEPNCPECSTKPDEGTRIKEPVFQATEKDDPDPITIPGESKRKLDL